MKKRCRHYGSWLLCGGIWEWCYQCGALRELKPVGPNTSAPKSRWVRPVGPKGENPVMREFVEL